MPLRKVEKPIGQVVQKSPQFENPDILALPARALLAQAQGKGAAAIAFGQQATQIANFGDQLSALGDSIENASAEVRQIVEAKQTAKQAREKGQTATAASSIELAVDQEFTELSLQNNLAPDEFETVVRERMDKKVQPLLDQFQNSLSPQSFQALQSSVAKSYTSRLIAARKDNVANFQKGLHDQAKLAAFQAKKAIERHPDLDAAVGIAESVGQQIMEMGRVGLPPGVTTAIITGLDEAAQTKIVRTSLNKLHADTLMNPGKGVENMQAAVEMVQSLGVSEDLKRTILTEQVSQLNQANKQVKAAEAQQKQFIEDKKAETGDLLIAKAREAALQGDVQQLQSLQQQAANLQGNRKITNSTANQVDRLVSGLNTRLRQSKAEREREAKARSKSNPEAVAEMRRLINQDHIRFNPEVIMQFNGVDYNDAATSKLLNYHKQISDERFYANQPEFEQAETLLKNVFADQKKVLGAFDQEAHQKATVTEAQALDDLHNLAAQMAGQEGSEFPNVIREKILDVANGLITRYQPQVAAIKPRPRLRITGDNVTEETFYKAMEEAETPADFDLIKEDMYRWLKEQELNEQRGKLP